MVTLWLALIQKVGVRTNEEHESEPASVRRDGEKREEKDSKIQTTDPPVWK